APATRCCLWRSPLAGNSVRRSRRSLTMALAGGPATLIRDSRWTSGGCRLRPVGCRWTTRGTRSTSRGRRGMGTS
ncbi:hypothetical protein PIB30_063484, partial [Stylosanthes scabra]|nr:hypothetical protein [Stylosanthes scabra]